MADTLRLVGGGKTIDLYPWLTAKAKGMEALAGILGFGLPGVENFWFDGAGSGSTYRGSRVGRRVMKIPLKVYAANRLELSALLSDLSVALDPLRTSDVDNGVAQLFFGGPDGDEWFVNVVRSGGGDWARKTDSDDRTYFKTTIDLEAGDAFWTRNRPEQFTVKQEPSGNPLLPRIAKLRVGSAATVGDREMNNIGDTFAWAVFAIQGPTTGIVLTGPNGEVLQWDGTLALGETLTIDMRANTVEDQTGANRYNGLAPAPRFWSVAPGTSEVSVQLDDITADSLLVAQWWPRRWAVV
jgi:hypothetical protein